MCIWLRRTALNILAASTVIVFFQIEPVAAQSTFGVHAGVSADPDQFYFGVHGKVAEAAQKLWFRPSAEVGFGNRATVATFNGEFVYYPAVAGKWKPYFGGGPGIVLSTFRVGTTGRNTDVGPGFGVLLGVEQRKGLLGEIKVGAFDSPGFKLGIGWNW